MNIRKITINVLIKVISIKIVKKAIYKYFAKRFIAGEKMEDAKKKAQEISKKGFVSIINFLGEETKTEEDALNVCHIYIRIAKDPRFPKESRISIKPSHLGLKLGYDFYLNTIKKLARRCQIYNVPLEIDMEEYETIEKTLKASITLKKEMPDLKLRQALQIRVRRTQEDIENLIKNEIKIRLCKGAYKTPKGLSLSKKEIKEKFLFYNAPSKCKYSDYIEFATHDSEILKELVRNPEASFQFLLGFKKITANKLAEKCKKPVIYIPFGKEWVPYGVRRFFYILCHLRNILLDDILLFILEKRR
jgi:proline dehydrogenase